MRFGTTLVGPLAFLAFSSRALAAVVGPSAMVAAAAIRAMLAVIHPTIATLPSFFDISSIPV